MLLNTFTVIFHKSNVLLLLRIELFKKFEKNFAYTSYVYSKNLLSKIIFSSSPGQSLFLASKVFFIELVLIGLGFKLSIKNKSLRLSLGYSHIIFVSVPRFVFLIKRKTKLLVYSLNKNLLSSFVFQLLSFKKLNAYKVRGLKQKNIVVKLKPGKRTK